MSTIKQKSAFVQIEGGARIEVRRMKWKPAQEFLRLLSAAVVRLYNEGRFGELISGSGAIKLEAFDVLLKQLPALVTESEQLLAHLVTSSSTLTIEQFNELDSLAASEVLSQSLAVNFDDELKNCWAGIVRNVAGVFPAKVPTAQPTN